MIFSFDLRRARKGDCFLLHYGTKADPGLMLVDGGPARVYGPELKPRLAQIRAARGLAAKDTLPIDGLMISHIDDDHINGILEMTGELVAAQEAHRPLSLKVRSFWFNTFDRIVGNDPAGLVASVTSHFGAASLAGEPDTEGLNPDAARVLASVDQGLRLGDDVRKLHLPLNPAFGGGLVMAAQGAAPLPADRGLSLTIAGPMQKELLALQKSYSTFLEQQTGRTREAVASFTDTSVPNLSSIVAVASAGGKRVLLTGDARGDKILSGLELAGVLAPRGTLHVDVLKMPHHGSDRNMEVKFLKRITADHYVFSGNGENGNPERTTLDMLRQARGESAAYTIHLTYPVADIDREREKDWKNQQAIEKTRKKKKPSVVVRADWSAADNGVAAYLAAHPAFAARVSIVEEDKPHVIDLLDPLGF